MKSDVAAHKKRLAARAETELPLLLVGYKPDDLAQLGRLCECVCQLDEHLTSGHAGNITAKHPELIAFLRGKYRSRIVLILSYQGRVYNYTMHDITRFVRGEAVHGKSDNRDAKRQALHNYVFENDNTIEWEFIVCWNWISGPNLRSDNGNLDTNGPFVHSINLNGNRREVSLIESIILSGIYEFWQIATNNPQRESTKCFVKFDPLDYEPLWGKELSQKVDEQLRVYGCLKHEQI